MGKRVKWMGTLIGGGVLAAGLVAAGVGAAGAATPTSQSSHSSATHCPKGGHHRPPPAGKVTSFSSTSLTFQDPRGGTHTATLTGSTTFTKDGASASASDLAVGEYVVIQPVRPATKPAKGQQPGPLTASAVHIVPSLPNKGNGPPPHGSGSQPSTGSGQTQG